MYRHYRYRFPGTVIVLKRAMIAVLLLNLIVSDGISALKEAYRTKHVRHYEPVHYDHEELLRQHHMTKRSTSDYIDFRFEAYGKEFNTRLTRDLNVLHPDVVIETSQQTLPYDVTRVYRGHIEGEMSKLTGVITKEGHFEGKLHTRNETYFIERAKYIILEPQKFHSVIYKLSDVTFNTSMTSCVHDRLRQRQKELVRDVSLEQTPASHDNAYDHTLYNKYLKEKNTDQEFVNTHSQTIRKQLLRRKRNIDPLKVTCDLYMQADHLYYQKYGSDVDATIEKLTQHVQAINSIYNAVDFDGSGAPENIGFVIRKIKVYTDTDEPGYKYAGPMDVEYFLDKHSEDNYDSFCLSYLFTYRDFSAGVLGLAWVGDVTDAGGVCEKHNVFKGVGKSLNSGVITVLNYGSDIPSAVSQVTFAHEVGHNFGSSHDEDNDDDCSPGDPDGNFIMYAHATSGIKSNNNQFSRCSIENILPVINKKGRSSDGCFLPSMQSICGNRVVDPGEECDCGWEEDCVEGCCNPQVYNTSGRPTPCTKKATSVCSPSEGPCCTDACQFRANTHECRSEMDCLSSATCDGTSAVCPVSSHVNDTTPCGDSEDFLVCRDGECSGSVCLAYGRESCQCAGTRSDSWDEDILCHVCCLDNGACKSSFDLDDVPDAKAVSGSPCNDYGGYCDVFKKCVHVDPSGPLSNLEKLLFSSETLDTLKDWLTKHWYVGVAAGVGLILIIGLVVKFCAKSSSGSALKTFNPRSNVKGPIRKPSNQNQVTPDRWM